MIGLGLVPMLALRLECKVCGQPIDMERRAETAVTVALVGAAAYAVCPSCLQEAPAPRDRLYRRRARQFVRKVEIHDRCTWGASRRVSRRDGRHGLHRHALRRSSEGVPMSVTADDLDELRHMLGCEPERSRKLWGFRNYYVGHTAGMDRLIAAGFARQVRSGSELTGGDPVYAATREGCRAAGMTEREITRMERDR